MKMKSFCTWVLSMGVAIGVMLGTTSAIPVEVLAVETQSVMSDFEIKGNVLWQYRGKADVVVIPDGVTRIANWAFSSTSNMKRVEIPDSVTSIGDYAFDHCSDLVEVKGGKNVREIGIEAFTSCFKLYDISGFTSVETIGEYAFLGCEKLERMDNSLMNVKNMGTGSFKDCDALRNADGFIIVNHEIQDYKGTAVKVIIPDGVTVIQNEAFDSKELETVVIPDSVTEIQDRAFAKCDNIKSITMSKNLKQCGEDVLSNITLKQASNKDGFYTIGNILVKYKGTRKKVTIPNGIQVIGEHAFERNKTITEVVIPSGVVNISKSAFDECTNLKKVTIPNGVTSIGSYAFRMCRNLKTVKIPSSVRVMYPGAFSECNKLEKVVYSGKGMEMPFVYHSYDCGDVYGFYQFADCEKLKDKNGFVIVNNILFGYYGKEKNVIIPQGVTAIDASVFAKNKTVETVILPASMKYIGNRAFEYCKNLKSINFPEGMIGLSYKSFRECSSLTKVVLPKSLHQVGSLTFCGCKKLETVVLPYGAKTIDMDVDPNVFGRCDKLKDILFYKDSYKVHLEAFDFSYSGELKYVEDTKVKATAGDIIADPESKSYYVIKDVKKKTVQFVYCTDVTADTIVIPEEIKSNGKTYTVVGLRGNAFADAKKLKKIEIKSTKLSESFLSSKAFTGVKSKVTVKVPSKKFKTYKSMFVKKGLSKKVKVTK